MVTEIELIESGEQCSFLPFLRFLFVRLDEERGLQEKGGCTRWLAHSVLDAAAPIKKLEDQLRRTTRYLSTRVGKFVEFFFFLLCEDFRKFILNCNKFVISL